MKIPVAVRLQGFLCPKSKSKLTRRYPENTLFIRFSGVYQGVKPEQTPMPAKADTGDKR